MKERFPDVIWICDNCKDIISDQKGFNDHHDIWICTRCGYENSISSDNIHTNNRRYDMLQYKRYSKDK